MKKNTNTIKRTSKSFVFEVLIDSLGGNKKGDYIKVIKNDNGEYIQTTEKKNYWMPWALLHNTDVLRLVMQWDYI